MDASSLTAFCDALKELAGDIAVAFFVGGDPKNVFLISLFRTVRGTLPAFSCIFEILMYSNREKPHLRRIARQEQAT